MQMTLTRDALYSAVSSVQRATATRVIQPILANILVELDVDKASLQLTATDMDFTIQTVIPAMITTSGRFTLSAKKWVEILSKLPAGATVQMTVDEQQQQARIVCDHSSFELRTMPADEYPLIPVIDQDQHSDLNLALFNRAIQQTAFAADVSQGNSVLAGVFFVLSPTRLEMVATDGSRLARRQEVVDTAGLTEPVSAIIPARSLQEFTKLVGSAYAEDATVRLAISSGQLSLRTERFYVLTRLLDGQYPQFQQLIPKENKLVAYAKKASLVASLERAAVMANERTNVVKLDFSPDLLHLAANTPDLGDAQDALPVEFNGDQTLQIAFNYKYVLDALKVIDSDDVRMETNGALAPALFQAREDNNYVCVVMPVQVR